MKNLIVSALATLFLVTSVSHADIQSPPDGKYNRIRKLSRGVGNVLYGINELPSTWARTVDEEGSVHGASIGIIRGSYRSLVRAGYGVYEFGTFPIKTYKGSFRPAYRGKSIWWDLNHGYHELAPELGFQTRFGPGRAQAW